MTDLLGNPVESIQQIVGNVNDRARNLNELTAAAAQEKDLYGPKSQQLASLLAEAYNPIGLTVYHGSPAKFTKFDPTKIGSGEGAQAYGYGHYVAESPGVAKDYQRRLAKESQATDLNTKMQMVDVGGKPLTSFNVDMDASLLDAAKAGKTEFVNLAESKKARWQSLSQDQSYPFQDYAKQKVGAYNSLLDAAKKSDVDYTGTGMFYEIDLPDEQIARMLDWDKPLSQQPENVRSALEQFGYKVSKKEVDDYSDALLNALTNESATGQLPKQPLDMSGESIYRKLRQSYANNERLNAERDALIAKYQKEGMSWSDSVRAMSKEDRAKFVDIASQIESQKDASAMTSEALRQAGVPGIRYLDQGSRGAGEGTSNFVVFPGNEGLLTIQKRNNEVIAPTSLLDYRGSHTAPGPDFGAPLHDLTGGGQMYPADVYSPKAAQYYGGGVPYDQKAFDIAQSFKDKPNATVTIYRAVPNVKSNSEKLADIEKQMAAYMKRGTLPKDAENFSSGSKWYDWAYDQRENLRNLPDEPAQKLNINSGDWVTLTKEYAKDHGESALKGDYKIISKKVKAKDLWTNADSIHEFGYHPSE